jgi:exopolyphosphatase/guanosine-5'-triphosphate,3'-diphosphate pyrophosphatase
MATDSSWTEPKSDYKAVYPYNHITQTESGHFIEMDDTPDAERVRIQHRTGTFTEIQADGSRINKILEMKINVIDGAREAELINDVVVQSLHPEKNYLHIDVGGGSTELNIYRNREKLASKSFKIGSVRLLEGKEKESDWDKMKQWISSQIVSMDGPIYAVGTGGNISKLYNISSEVNESKTMTMDELKKIAAYVSSFTFEERVHKLRLNTDRADVIVPASSIYLAAMECAGSPSIFVPDLGLKDGILQMLYDRYKARKKA